MPDFVKTCEEAARAGGAMLRHWIGRFQVREKGPADLVTEADLASQEAIRALVLGKFPDHGFIGEEGEPSRRSEAEYQWIVDPLDGTTNYVHGVPHFSVSVALEHRGKILAGVVYDPTLDECFTAGEGRGTTLNGRPVRTSSVKELGDALIAASLPAKVLPDSLPMAQFAAIAPTCQAIRRGGSTAINLAYVAAGRFDGFWGTDAHPWDVAAGILLITEAGGVIVAPDGGSFDLWRPRLVAAAGPEIQQQLCRVLSEVE